MSESRHSCSSLGSWPVDRIAIVGCGGSGKSRLARSLGQTLGITPVHLDGLYYDRDWKPLDKEQFAALQRDLVAAPRWIIDGNYASSLPIRLQAADTVIFLDLPAWACLRGIIQRRLRHGGGQHDAIGVYDRITWNFIRYIAGYRKQMAPRVRQLIADHPGDAQVVVLRSRRVARRYLVGVAAPRSAAASAVAAGEEQLTFTDLMQIRGTLIFISASCAYGSNGDHSAQAAHEQHRCLRTPAEGPHECDLYLTCAKFVTTPAYAPRLRARREVEETLALDAAARGWDREVERHRCTSQRIEKLLADLGEPLDSRGGMPE